MLVSNSQTARNGIRTLVQNEKDFQVIGESANGQDGLGLLARLHPDIVVTDLLLKHMTGIELCQKSQEVASANCIILSLYDSEAYVTNALLAGVKGYVLTENRDKELVQAIRSVISGKVFLSPQLPKR
jgi:DNA-binding NarL/FixJ family response regulator